MLEQILLQKQLERLQNNEGLYHPQAVRKVKRKKKIERQDSYTDSDGIHHDHISEHWVEEEVEKDQFNNTIYRNEEGEIIPRALKPADADAMSEIRESDDDYTKA